MPRILLVDDDIAEISAVKRVLARSGHQPVLATNASDAMAAVNQLPPDLLVVGATCEGGEALAMAARIASGEAGIERFPMLVLGEGPGTPEGAVVIPRPVDPAQLADQVARSLGGAERAPAEPPSPGRRTAQPVARIAPSRAPSRGATIIPPPPPGPPPAPAPAPAAAPAPAVPARRVTDARPPRASPPPRHDAPAAAPRPALSVEVTAALEPLSARAGTRPSARSAPPPPPGPDARRVAAAEALRARAEELRRATPSPRPPQRPISEEVVDDELDALLERVDERPAAELAAELEADLGMRESAAPDPDHEAEALAAAQAAAQAAAEAEALAAAEAGLEARRRTEDEARRARDAEARVQAEADARRGLEAELERLRRQLEDERRGAERELARERERSAASSDAAEELSRLAEEQASERAAEEARRREEQEEELRRAIESARADMEALRRRNEEEARRRAEVEAELTRLTQEAARKAAAPTPSPGPETRGALATFDFPEPAEPMPPPPDPAEEEARLRALASARADVAEGAAPSGTSGRAPAPPPLPPPELRSGTIADLPAPRLLALAWKARLAGRLDFQGAAARSIHFEDGRVVGATSAEPSERLEELALRLGLVTRDQYRQAAPAAAALPPRRAALLLLERGYLKPNELTGLVRRRAEEILFGLFVDESARFRWVGAEVPPEERVGLDRGTLALAVEGIRRRWLAPRLDAVLGGASTLLQPTQGGPSAGELALSAEERKVVALADGLRTLDEIEAASPLDPLSTRQVLAALVLAGGLTVRVLGAGRAAGIAAAAIDLARVRDKLDQARRADYFTILGVGRLCTPHEVREAAARLTAEFAPARFQGVREEGLPSRLDEILRVVADAREVLADERLREEYLKGLGE